MTEKTPQKENPPIDDPRAMEEKIKSLSGVLSSRIVTNRDREILEIHVVAAAGRGPKQILRDVESTLLAEYGVRVDRRKVSIAQLEGEGAAPAAQGSFRTPLRLRFEMLQTRITPREGEVEVALSRENLRGIGKATFPLSSGAGRAVAEATLRAVEQFIRDGRFEILDFDTRPVGSHRGCFVHVEYASTGRAVPLIGSALVDRDPNLAALHATLDAVNRFIGRLKGADGVEWVVGAEPPSPS